MTPLLLPTQSVYLPGQAILVEASHPGDLVVTHLGEAVREVRCASPGLVDLGELIVGGYGVAQPSTGASSAVQVCASASDRLRYGFVASFRPGKDVEAVARFARRLHLTGIQFYDWAYRHADLLGGGEEYRDALDQPISLATVRALVEALRAAGARSIGYAAVYGVGNDEWEQWEDAALLDAAGEPYSLADFLRIVDPAHPRWLEHFAADVAAAAREVGFDGFHLDQYGYPKMAVRPDGEIVDVAASFDTLIRGVRGAVPDATLVFNNVNDFPTWSSPAAPQDAVYIEPWEPVTTYEALARVATRARLVAGGKPVILAAYQSIYDKVARDVADASTRLTMATLFSHGATQLLAGEDGRLLVDPYYVRNMPAEDETLDMLANWYDFLVANDEILMDPGIVDVTASYVGEYNGDIDVSFEAAPVCWEASPGCVWRRVTRAGDALVVHLINLVGQSDTVWDGPHRPAIALRGGTLRLKPLFGRVPRVYAADPDAGSTLIPLDVRIIDGQAVVSLPDLNVWQVLHVLL